MPATTSLRPQHRVHLELGFTPEWVTASSTDEILAGLAWRVAETGGRVLRHRTELTGRVVAVVASEDANALLGLLATRKLPALAHTTVNGSTLRVRDGLDYVAA